jgi:hypothetical protein
MQMRVQPKMGDIVTFEHEIFSRREIPTTPKIVRIRKDVNWEDVVRDHVLLPATLTLHKRMILFVAMLFLITFFI